MGVIHMCSERKDQHSGMKGETSFAILETDDVDFVVRRSVLQFKLYDVGAVFATVFVRPRS